MRKGLFLALFALVLMGCAKNVASSESDHQFVEDKYGVVQRIDTAEKNVYLVFTGHYSEADSGHFENFDGIEPVLNTLKEKGVKGSFFPTGACYRCPKYEASIKRIISEGHYLSHHSNKHLLMCPEELDKKDKVNLVTEDSIRQDMAEMEAVMKKFGLEKDQYIWMIPPYENYNQFSADILRSCGYKLLNPTQETLFTSLDWAPLGSPDYLTGDSILNKLWQLEETKGLNGCILLVHAMYYPDRNDKDRLFTRLPEIIDHLKAKGYGFKCVNELLP